MHRVDEDSSQMLRRLLQRPELRPLVGGTELVLGPAGPAGVMVPAPNRLVLAPARLAGPLGPTLLRLGLELAWLVAARPDQAAPTGLIAARVAALYLALEPVAARLAAAADPLLAGLPGLAGELPGRAELRRLAPLLAALRPAGGDGACDFDSLRRLWPLAAPAEQLMTTGGDARLQIDPATGLNRYGCSPRPRPWAITFASCTASSISERGYGAAEACRRRLLRAALNGGVDAGLAEEAAVLRAGILAHWDVEDLAEAVLAPSGTDAALLLTALLRAAAPNEPSTTILMSPGETGSGVPLAATLRHFAEASALGRRTSRGAGLADDRIGLATVALRDSAGRLHTTERVAAQIVRTVGHFARQGRVVLHLLDGSKTGLLAPEPELAGRLAAPHGNAAVIMVDACQARLGRRQMRRYLDAGQPVLVTGSKFYTGPPFSGALLVPRRRQLRAAGGRLPAALAGYSSAADWPLPAPAAAAPGGNPGLLLRWAAALAEMRGFAAVAMARRAEILDRFGAAVAACLAADPRLVPLPSPAPLRHDGEGWDERQTIFPFAVRDPARPGRLLDGARLARLYQWLNSDLSDRLPQAVARRPCHIGQPVRLGSVRRGCSALRLAAGARLVSGEPSHAQLEDEARLRREIDDLGELVAKLGVILDALPLLEEKAALGA